MKIWNLLIAATAIPVFSAHAYAQDESTKSDEVLIGDFKVDPKTKPGEVVFADRKFDPGEIVVTANGTEQNRAETGHAVTVVTQDDLATGQFNSIGDALQLVPGVAVAQSGAVGGQTSVFIRGAESSQTLVLIDGVRINDPSTPNAAFDFGAMLTGNIDRVEILRGANSVIWGSQAMGGVINVQTFAPTEQLTVNARTEYASHDSASAFANVSGKSGIVSGSFGGGYYRTDGISSLANGTEKDGYRNSAANGKLLIELSPAFTLDLRGYYNKGRIEYDDAFGFPVAGDTAPESHNEQFVGYAALNHQLLNGKWKGHLSYSRTDLTREGSERGSVGPFNYNVFTARGKVDRFAYDGNVDFGMASIVFGVAHENTFASTFFPMGGDIVPTTFKSHYDSFYGQLGVKPVEGLTVNGGIRYEDHSQYGDHSSFGADAAYTPDNGKTILRTSYAEGYRAPSLSEALPPFGNIKLKPETSKGYDVGIERRFIDGKVAASVTWFHRTSDDLIVYNPATFQSENIGRAKSKGVELGLVIRPNDDLDIRANYALVDATSQSPGANFGHELARRPRNKASFVADWKSPWGVKLGSTLTLTGDSFDNLANTVRLDGYWMASVRAAFPINGKVEVYGRVENLFDQDYAVVSGYSTSGRTAAVGIRARF